MQAVVIQPCSTGSSLLIVQILSPLLQLLDCQSVHSINVLYRVPALADRCTPARTHAVPSDIDYIRVIIPYAHQFIPFTLVGTLLQINKILHECMYLPIQWEIQQLSPAGGTILMQGE